MLCSFTETPTEDQKPVSKAGTKKRKLLRRFPKPPSFRGIVSNQQAADRRFMETEEARKRREEEREEKRRKEA